MIFTMTNKSTLATISIGNKLIAVNSLALLIQHSNATSNQDNLFSDFVSLVSSKYKVNIPMTIIFNEPKNYSQFIEALQLEHSPELFAAYEFCSVGLQNQPPLLNLINKITGMLWSGELKTENLCAYLYDSIQSI